MPELPEVETIVRELRPVVSGRRVDYVHVNRRDIIHGDTRPLSRLLTGHVIRDVRRRAKRIILDIEPDVSLVIHLGMSGRLTLADSGASIEKHTHLQLGLSGSATEIRFRDPRRFGGVWCITNKTPPDVISLGALGPEPLEMRLKEFATLLRRRRRIKPLLMDQGIIAGLGNIYCDESLHRARIHPTRAADNLHRDDAHRLLRAIKTTLRRAIRHNGTTINDYRRANGSPGTFQRHHRVYQREGEVCKSCRTATIERIIVCGRSTFYCPRCQPEYR